MFRRLVVFLCVAALAASGASLLIAQPAVDAERALKMKDDGPVSVPAVKVRQLAEPRVTAMAGDKRKPQDKNIPVLIIYDNGIVTHVPGVSSLCFGNQFNSATGVPVKSFSLTRVSAYILPAAGSDNVFFSVFTGGTSSPMGGMSASVPLNNGPGAFNTWSIGTPYTGGGSFLAGVWYIAGDTVGLGTGTINGQGHHAMAINDCTTSGCTATGFTQITSLNALVGAGTAFIPVELMDFTVTDH